MRDFSLGLQVTLREIRGPIPSVEVKIEDMIGVRALPPVVVIGDSLGEEYVLKTIRVAVHDMFIRLGEP